MPKNKRISDLERADEKKQKNAKPVGRKGVRTAVATSTICAAAFGAYYSPYFRTLSSDWLERGFLGGAKTSSTDVDAEVSAAAADEEMRQKLAQAPSFRDFLTDEYGEEGARELLGTDGSTPDVSAIASESGGFADYVASETDASETPDLQEVANGWAASSVPASSASDVPASPPSFADFVAAETVASETPDSQEVANGWAASSVPASSASDVPTSAPSFADFVAAETVASETPNSQGVANGWAASSVPASSASDVPTSAPSFADYVAAKPAVDLETNGALVNSEKTRLASAVEPAADGNETALTARLEAEMKERGVGNPQIERWGGRFWRASGFATTSDGVATFCEAVDVDPTAAQRAALAKFEAASF